MKQLKDRLNTLLPMMMKSVFVILFALMLSGCGSMDMIDTMKEFADGAGDSEFTGCWFCPAFGIAFDALNRLATNVATKLGGIFLIFLGLGMLFFLLFKIGKYLIKLQEVNLMQFLEELFRPLGRMMIAAVLLAIPLGIYSYLITPMTQLGFVLADEIYTEVGVGEMSIVRIARDKARVDLTVQCKAEGQSQTTFEWDKAFDPGVRQSLLCNLQQVSNSLLLGMASSHLMIRAGLAAKCVKIPLIMDVCFPAPTVILTGSVFFFMFLGLLLYYPMKLLDALCRLAFVTALMPLWIVFWAFPATAGYAKKAWDLFLSSLVYFVALGIVMAIILLIVDQFSFPDRYWELGFAGEWIEAADELPKGYIMPLLAGVIALLSLKLLAMAGTLSNTFVGATDLGVNNAASGHMMQGIQVAQNAGSAMVNAVKTGGIMGMAHLARVGAKARSFEKSEFSRGAGSSSVPHGSGSGWVPASGGEHVTGQVEKITPDGLIVNYTNDYGQSWQNIYDQNGLKEFHKIHDTYSDGSAKTVDVHDSYGHLIGHRIYDEETRENWVQQNTDGSQTTHRVNRMPDGTVIEETQTYNADGALISTTESKTVQETDENGLEVTRKETIYSDLLTGFERKVSETGETDESGVYRVFDRETDETVNQGGEFTTDKKKERFTYDGQGHLQTRKTYDAGGQLQTTRYYTDSGVKADGSYTFGFRDYTVDAEGKAVQTGKPTLYYVKGRGK